jgi:hypothetical protein
MSIRAVDKHQPVLQLSAVRDEVMREGAASGADIQDYLPAARQRWDLLQNIG